MTSTEIVMARPARRDGIVKFGSTVKHRALSVVKTLSSTKAKLAAVPLFAGAWLMVQASAALADGTLDAQSYSASTLPGTANTAVGTSMGWYMRGASVALVAAAVLHAGRAAHAHRNNGGGGIGEHLKGYAGVGLAAVMIGAAPTAINSLA
jgi:hypothetical protein